jgi:two-component system chemotaxis response regulator CheB
MTAKTLKVLVVDDSALMRKYLRRILESEPDIQAFMARDGQDALDQIKAVDPDVVTLDINMPVMDGLSCLNQIMNKAPRPVVMVSSLTEKGALATFEALELGAVDYVAKPGGTVSRNIEESAGEILAKVRSAAGARLKRRFKGQRRAIVQPEITAKQLAPSMAPAVPARVGKDRLAKGLVLIGVSTGGPGTLENILSGLSADFPLPVLVCQHMPANFTKVFAQRLSKVCLLKVMEVDRPTPLEAGQVLIAKGDHDVILQKRLGRRVALNVPPQQDLLWHPSVERMVNSAMEHYQPHELIAVELTGMGYDGAEAMARLHQEGGRTIAEAEESAVVFGMPKELIERGGADVVLHMEKIAAQLTRWSGGDAKN